MGGSPEGTLFGGLFWISVCGFWFARRRGWIQHYFEQQQLQQEQDKLREQQQRAERHQQSQSAQSSTSANSSASTTTVKVNSTIQTLMVEVSSETNWSPTQALGLIRAIVEKYGSQMVQLSVVAQAGKLGWQVLPQELDLDEQQREAFENTVQTFYPDAKVHLVPQVAFEGKLYRRYHIFESQTLYYFQRALSVHKIKRDDPLASVATAIGNLREGECMRYSLTLFPPYRHNEEEVFNLLTHSASEAGYRPDGYHLDTRSAEHVAGSVIGSTIGWGLQKMNLRNTRVDRFTPTETQTFLEKLGQPLLPGFVTMMLDTPDKTRLGALEDAMSSVMGLSGEEIRIGKGYSSKTLEIVGEADWWEKDPLDYLDALAPDNPQDPDGRLSYLFHLTSEEVAALWHLPHQHMNVSDITWASPPLPSEVITDKREGRVVIGQTEQESVSLAYQDLRRHAFISGQTGTGKSNFLHNLAHQLIESDQGFAILDPHADLIRDILKTSVLQGKQDKVLLLDLNNTTHPIPLNPFRVPDGVSPKFAYNLVLWIMKTVYKNSWGEGQMETVIRRTLELVLTDPEATPLDMQRVLRNDNYRRKRFKEALEQGMSTSAEMWWQDEYDALSPSARTQKTLSTLNRLRIFLDGVIEQMTCHPHGLDFRKLISEGYVLLINLKGDEIESEVGVMGAILLAQLYMTCYSLGDQIAGDAPPRYYLIIDETHTFITTALDKMLSEARKYGLSLIMADQWLGQLDKDTQAAIRNNRGTTISFRASEEEAPSTARLYEPQVSVKDLMSLHVGQAAIRTLSDGNTLPAFQLQTLPPLPAVDDASLQVTWDSLWQQTIETLDLMPAGDVRRWIRTRYRSKGTDVDSDGISSTADTDIEIVDEDGEG